MQVKYLLRRDKLQYTQKWENDLAWKPSKFWIFVANYKSGDDRTVAPIKDGNTITDLQLACEELCSQSASVYQNVWLS